MKQVKGKGIIWKM